MKFDTLELVPPLLLQIISCIRYFLANTDCLGFTISTPLMSYVMGISYRLALRASFPRGWVGGGGDKAIGTTQPFEGLRYLLEHGGNVGGVIGTSQEMWCVLQWCPPTFCCAE